MTIRRVNHVVLAVSNLEKSTNFYRDILELEFVATLPAEVNWPEMRFFRSAVASSNHHDLAIIASATLPRPGWGQPTAPGIFHVALEVGTIEELEQISIRLRRANSIIDLIEQPMHLSVYGKDPDGIPLEIIWRIPDNDWTYEDLWRRPLDFDAAKDRWGSHYATGSAAGESA